MRDGVCLYWGDLRLYFYTGRVDNSRASLSVLGGLGRRGGHSYLIAQEPLENDYHLPILGEGVVLIDGEWRATCL
jgi:hypothetical protein